MVDLQLCTGLLAVLCQPVRSVLDDGLLDALCALPRLQDLSEEEKEIYSSADKICIHIDTDL